MKVDIKISLCKKIVAKGRRLARQCYGSRKPFRPEQKVWVTQVQGLTRDLRPPPFPFAKLARCSQRPFSELNFEHRICPIEGEVRAGIVRELVVDRTEWYRARAAECEAMAFCTPDPHARALFEEMAATWRKLAERVEKWQLQ